MLSRSYALPWWVLGVALVACSADDGGTAGHPLDEPALGQMSSELTLNNPRLRVFSFTYAGSTFYSLLYVPTAHDTDAAARFPLVIAHPGQCERVSAPAGCATVTGDRVEQLRKLVNASGSIPNIINRNVMSADMQRNLILAPQVDYPRDNAWNAGFTAAAIAAVSASYRVDEARIHITGLSAGGGFVGNYVKRNADKLATWSVMSNQGLSDLGAQSSDWDFAKSVAGIWLSNSIGDADGNQLGTISRLAAASGGAEVRAYWYCNVAPQVRPTNSACSSSPGHVGGWTIPYEGNTTYHNPNFWTWLGTKSRTVGNLPPTVNAGADVVLTLPTNGTTLVGTATDSDGTVAHYAWSQVSGPTSATLTNQGTSTLTVSNLEVGSYVFQLTARDNLNAAATDTVTVTVRSGNVPASWLSNTGLRVSPTGQPRYGERLIDGVVGPGDDQAFAPGWIAASSFPVSADIDLGAFYDLSKVRTYSGNRTSTSRLYVSSATAAGAFAPLVTVTNGTYGAKTETSFNVTRARYVRVAFQQSSDKFNLAEIEFFGAPVP